ncbi:MAG: hypothetical protein ACKVX9_12580 [Blastocatellia bacterium]
MLIGLWICGGVVSGRAQGFVSGSTGADGAFSPASSQSVQLPPSGVFNFTTVTIPSGATITFIRNAGNTPVTILATGNVTINGTISVAGADTSTRNVIGAPGGLGGPGGFNGGRGGTLYEGFTTGLSGDGPGGGGGGGSVSGNNVGSGGGGGFALPGGNGVGQNAGSVIGQGGLSYGTRTLLPLIGGSGGGGGGATTTLSGTAGGGGGGAILIASSGTIAFGASANILANGGGGYLSTSAVPRGGGGSGGAIRLIANLISGGPDLDVSGGGGGTTGTLNGGAGSHGYIRVEAFNYSNFDPNVSPAPGGINTVMSLSSPGSVTLANVPQLRIVSIAGVNAPASPLGSFGSPPDIVLPSTQSNPVSVAITGANIPLGTFVRVSVATEFGAIATVQSTQLTGTIAESSATASVTLPVAVSLLTATAFIDLTQSTARAFDFRPFLLEGERVIRMEVAVGFGGKSRITYITESGKRISQAGE